MSNRVALQRWQQPPGVKFADMPAGRWGIWNPCGDFPCLVIACPDCGKHSSVIKHSIAADGTSEPSYVCPHPPCGWHVFVRLDGWTFGAKAAGSVTVAGAIAEGPKPQ